MVMKNTFLVFLMAICREMWVNTELKWWAGAWMSVSHVLWVHLRGILIWVAWLFCYRHILPSVHYKLYNLIQMFHSFNLQIIQPKQQAATFWLLPQVNSEITILREESNFLYIMFLDFPLCNAVSRRDTLSTL